MKCTVEWVHLTGAGEFTLDTYREKWMRSPSPEVIMTHGLCYLSRLPRKQMCSQKTPSVKCIHKQKQKKMCFSSEILLHGTPVHNLRGSRENSGQGSPSSVGLALKALFLRLLRKLVFYVDDMSDTGGIHIAANVSWTVKVTLSLLSQK